MVMVCVPTGVAPVSWPGEPHAVTDIAAARSAKIKGSIGQPLRLRRKPVGMMSRISPASKGIRALVNKAEADDAGLGALVCTTSVELPLPPATEAGEKLHVVFAGSSVQLRVTGRLKSALGMTVTV